MPDQQDADAEAIARALRRTWYTIYRHHTPSEHLAGLQKQGLWVLLQLTCGPRRMTELAELADISPTSLTGVIDRLQDRDLVRRFRSDDDRRVVMVEITEVGRAEMDASKAWLATSFADLLGPLSKTERAQLLALLEKMTEPKGM